MYWLIALILLSTPLYATEETEGLRAMRLGCEKQKSALGCYNYANLLLNRGETSAAKTYFKKGCKLGHNAACNQEPWESSRTPTSQTPNSEADFSEN